MDSTLHTNSSSSGATAGAAPALAGFELLDKLGEGAFGTVYRARDLKLDRLVAVKLLRPRPSSAAGDKGYERFLAEARALARIRHPNVLAVHAVLDTDAPGSAALVTELIDGVTLSEVVDEHGPLGAGEAARAGADICRALSAVHAAGIVHRDVKPLNVMRERGGRIVLLDFGLGVFSGQGQRLDEAGTIAGSPLFMAPEQVLGQEVTPRTDLYALGVLLYFLSTGKYPIVSFDLRQVFHVIAQGQLRPLRDARPDLPPAFVQAVMRALERDPAARFASAGEMEHALLSSLSAGAEGVEIVQNRAPALAPSPTPPAPPASPVRRGERRARRWRIAAVIGIALASVMALVLSRLNGPPSPLDAAVFHLEASSTPLGDGARIAGGSRLQLDVRLRHATYLYVLNEDERGNVHVLFPRRDAGPANPLAPSTLHRLPGMDESWEASPQGGKELLVLVASTARQEMLEEAARREELTGEEVGKLLRGFPRVVPRQDGRRSAKALVSAYLGDLQAAGGIPNGGGAWLDRGLWVSALTLQNQ